jgi:iron complex outermembrane receptor protein
MKSRKSAVVGGVSIYALSLAFAAGASPAAADDAAGRERIVVTGSRIVQQTGMQTPVPVTAVSATELDDLSPGPLVEGIDQLPQFYGGTSPTNQGNFFARGGLGNLNLRGLGINRTLTLLNGRRMISQTAFGGVDVNLFPEAMINRVETVTGGASAAYGTDAVAGVVNFILDTDFTGVSAHAQAGVTDRGDYESHEVSLSYGRDLGDRAHVLLSGEYYENDGIFSYEDRDWYQAWGTIPGGPGGTLQARPNVVSANATLNGLISHRVDLNDDDDFDDPGETFSLHGYEFGSDGSSVMPFVLGEGNGFGNPGARQSITNGGSGDDLGAVTPTLAPDFERESFFAYLDYDVTDDLTVYAQFIRGRNYSWSHTQPNGSLHGTPTVVNIFADNAFLPQSVRDAMIAEGIESFQLKTQGAPGGLASAGMGFGDESVLRSYTGGFTMDVNSSGSLFDGWTVDGYYQYGVNERTWSTPCAIRTRTRSSAARASTTTPSRAASRSICSAAATRRRGRSTGSSATSPASRSPRRSTSRTPTSRSMRTRATSPTSPR